MRHQVYLYRRRLTSTSTTQAPDRVTRGRFSMITGPLVSCLMVTRGDPGLVRSSIRAFRAQTYRNKELVIVCDDITPELRSIEGTDIRLVAAGERLSLGRLRNLSLDAARGEIICQWDDDDLYAPFRLEHGVGALLQTASDALFLRQWMVWCPPQKVLALSRSRVWEGSMVALKSAVGRYPDLARREDTELVAAMAPRSIVAIMDDPLAYCYCIHGQNTFTGSHMQRIVDTARHRFHYGRGLAAFSEAFDFAGHPAFAQPREAATSATRGMASPRRHLALRLAYNQFVRRTRRHLGLWR